MASSNDEAPRATFASLPHALALRVFARLPADARARAACVATDWRTTADDVSLWTRLDLSRSSGVTCTVNDAALRGAAAKARGGLTALDVPGCRALTHDGSTALLAAVTANAGALRELRVRASFDDVWRGPLSLDAAEALLRAAPLLRVCEIGISCVPTVCPLLLRGEPPFGAISALELHASFDTIPTLAERVAALEAVLADVAASRSLRCLQLIRAPLHTPAALDALIDAVLTSRLPGLGLALVHLRPASAPALARLLGSNTLQTLYIGVLDSPLLDGPAAAVLAAALRANNTLTSLTLRSCMLFNDGAVAAKLLGALTAHPSLRKLDLSYSDCLAQTVVGVALGALIAANASALRELNISSCRVDDLGMGPLMDALPSNTHLRKLDCSGNAFSEAFVRERLLPAVRANTSLRAPPGFLYRSDAAREVAALFAARGSAC
jgi:hypothetical protein